MKRTLPQVKHTYQNHHLDSTRWERFSPRDDDIIIATSYKSGTTWMQMIVMHLIFGAQASPEKKSVSPWLDMRVRPVDDVMKILEAQQHRRFVKTHLPLDGLPFYPEAKYIVVCRDARDVFMSLWNHYNNLAPEFYQLVNETLPNLVGNPLPPCPQSIGEFWRGWITQGWFAWEHEGYPFWSNLGHVQSWWNFRSLSNILFVHFNDLLTDLAGGIKRIANFLDIVTSDDMVRSIAHATTFSTMQKNSGQIAVFADRYFEGGSKAFINKGTNGRWKHVLSPADLSLYQAAATHILSPECAAWLENGGESKPL